MGAIHFSLDEGLIEELKRVLPLSVFVETGTFQGETLALARSHFDRLHSVELVEEQYSRAAERFAGDDRVSVRCGDSADFLRELRPVLAGESVLYWLDAHWCGGTGLPLPTADHGQCPLLRELAALGSLNGQSVVLIDDARYFLAPPPSPNDARQWPRFDEVVDGLRALSADHEMLIVDDVIIFHPRAIRDRLRSFAERCGFDLSELVALAAAGQRSRGGSEASVRDIVALERLCAELHVAATERLELLEKLQRDYLELTERCNEFEKAANERLGLLQLMADERAAVEERLATFERAAAERLLLLEEVSSRCQAAEERLKLFDTALRQRDRRISELERMLDERSLELEALRGGRHRVP